MATQGLDPQMRKSVVLGNILQNLHSAGTQGPIHNLSDALMGAQRNQAQNNSLTLQGALQQRQADRLDKRLGFEQKRFDAQQEQHQATLEANQEKQAQLMQMQQIASLPESGPNAVTLQEKVEILSSAGPEGMKMAKSLIDNRSALQDMNDPLKGLPPKLKAFREFFPDGTDKQYKAWLKETNTPVAEVNVGMGKELSPAQEKVDKTYAAEYVKWTQGDSAEVQKNIGQLEGVLVALQSGENLTGPRIGLIPEAARKFLVPRAAAIKEQLEEVVQKNLKAILGAQFAQSEGERLIERAYNPALEEPENAERVSRLLEQMRGAAAAKDEAALYYETNGSLKGWEGTKPEKSDFLDDKDPKTKTSTIPKNMINSIKQIK